MTTTGSVAAVEKPKAWAKARVGLHVQCWFRGEPVARPAVITRLDVETGKAYLFVFHDGNMGTTVAREAPHRSVYDPATRVSSWDF